MFEEVECPAEAERRQNAIDKLVEDSKAHVQVWEGLQQVWEECLTVGFEVAAKLAKFVSDEAEGGNRQYSNQFIRSHINLTMYVKVFYLA